MSVLIGITLVLLSLAIIFGSIQLRGILDARNRQAIQDRDRMQRLIGTLYDYVTQTAKVDETSDYIKSAIESGLTQNERNQLT